MVAIHDHRPFLVRREQQVLAEHPFLRVFPRGGEAGDLGEVAFAVLVVTGQVSASSSILWAITSPSTAKNAPGSRICW